MPFCTRCGKPIDHADSLCTSCGTRQHEAPAPLPTPAARPTPETQCCWRVWLPYETPPGDVYIAGSFNGWAPNATKLEREKKWLASVVLSQPPDSVIKYKYTRGSWETVETASDGSPVANRELRFQHGSGPFDAVYGWLDIPARFGLPEFCCIWCGLGFSKKDLESCAERIAARWNEKLHMIGRLGSGLGAYSVAAIMVVFDGDTAYCPFCSPEPEIGASKSVFRIA